MVHSAVDGDTHLHLTALGVPIEVRVSGNRATALADEIRAAWDFCLNEPPAEMSAGKAEVVDVLLDSRPTVVEAAERRGVFARTDLDVLMHDLSPRITVTAIHHQAESLLMLHACGVADPGSGRVLALVGPSGAGKTTAARALAAAGYAYVTDETVGLRDDDFVAPYPKPLSVLHRTDTDLKAQVPPGSLGFQRPPADLRLGRLAVLYRDPDGPDRPDVEPVGTLAALAAVSPEISYLARRPRPLHRLAAMLHGTGGLVRVRYREAADLVPLVPELLGAP